MTTPRIFTPLRIRDFALLWTGMTVSLLGDGIYLVAIAWQVYELSNAPTALSVVGVAWTVPLVLFVLIGGVASDRFDRRKLMIALDILRAAAIAGMGALSLALAPWAGPKKASPAP
jgi:DHA3 family tetracycline resistance protein-like MFS transporter